ncbi:MAG: type II secretion system protein [Candidatus Wallbacteria bacterium]|nr:type II secretion system protein [Candidatus Wallbacteria bacterium]
MPRSKRSVPGRLPEAFTLVELLIALAIMLALVAMASGVFRENLDEAKQRVMEANQRAIRKAIAAFYNDQGRYPYNGQDKLGNVVQFLDNQSSELVQGVHDGAGTYPKNRSRYLREIPIDPTTGKADWLLVPCDNDGDWKPGSPATGWPESHQPGTLEWASSKGNTGGDDVDGDGRPSLMHNVAGHPEFEGKPEPHVDEDGFGGNPQDEDGDGKTDEDPPDVMDVMSRGPQ